MSGRHNKKDGMIYAPYVCNELEKAMFAVSFDEQVDYDLAIIKQAQDEEKLLRKMCWVKLLSTPIVYPSNISIFRKSIS